jgi:hypothetical protein
MAHFLLIYDRPAGRLLRQEQFDTSAEAMQARFAAEREYAGQRRIEVVVLSADSEEALRRTHGRYFLSLSELADRIG